MLSLSQTCLPQTKITIESSSITTRKPLNKGLLRMSISKISSTLIKSFSQLIHTQNTKICYMI